MPRSETLEFQAETRQLLQLMVHSIYSDKDIFLRELISNASDALDKLRLATYADKELQADTSDLHIEIDLDAGARTLTVRDNGIGMSRDDVVNLIGTIARSGTAELLAQMRATKDAAASADLIGQFGIGFYSTFMVADAVTLVTRRAGETEGTRWTSAGEGTYEIDTLADAPAGTSVTLQLKAADEDDRLFDYTDTAKIRQVVKRYSDFIAWPIRMRVDRAEIETEVDPGGEADPGAVDTVATETLNSQKALWARAKDEVSTSEYHEFYRHISHDWSDPLEVIALKAEGTFEYEALLFIPARAPYDLFMRDSKSGIQLYVKRVFIMDDCAELMPEYLRFVKGVVDARDLSLNVSREILQQDRQIQLMRRRLVKKVLSTVKEMRTDRPEAYRTFWEQFGKAMKEGLLNDRDNQDAILEVSSFATTHDPAELITLTQYVERMPEGQNEIYYVTGESRSTVEKTPHMEAFQAKGYEVLLLTDPIDEMWVDAVGSFDGKRLQSIAKGQVDLGSDDEQPAESEQDFSVLLAWMTTTLADGVKEVRLTKRLTTSAACIVGDEHDIAPALERMYRAMGQEFPPIKRILELNPTHPLVTGLREAYARDSEDGSLAEVAELLYGMALLAEGGDLDDPARFTNLLASRLASSLAR